MTLVCVCCVQLKQASYLNHQACLLTNPHSNPSTYSHTLSPLEKEA